MSEFDDIMGSPREPSEAGRVGKGEKAMTDGEAPLAGIRYLQGLFDALPGEEREQRWLQERLAMLSVRERYTAALELEHCRSLRFALDISQNRCCYDWVPRADLEESARGLLLDAGVSEELIHACGIDLAGYKAYLLESDGYTLSADGSYVRRNYEEFHYAYSTPIPEQSGMSMQ